MTNDFGRRLFIYRTRNNMLQRDLAEIFGVTKASISAWERGKSTPGAAMRTKLHVLIRDIKVPRAPRSAPKTTKKTVTKVEMHTIPLPYSDVATLELPKPVTVEDVAFMRRWLDVMEDELVECET